MSVDTAARDFETTWAEVSHVEGWLSDGQARRLWDAAARVGAAGRVVEIGSFRGRSTIVLRRAAPEGAEVVAIDPHAGGDRGPQEIAADSVRGDQDFRLFHDNLERAGVDDGVLHVRQMSQAALAEVGGPIDLLYIDGAHRYRPAREDIERWGARVPAGGTMLIHDTYNAVGVMLAQLRLLLPSRRWRYVGRTRSLSEYRREDLSAREVARNLARQGSGLPYFVRNGLIKVAVVARLGRLARRLGLPDEDAWPY